MDDFKSRKKEQEIKLGHKIGMTRRELLAGGVYAFSAGAMMPSLLSLLAREACAAETVVPYHLPFICFDMAGGAALPGNFLVGKAGGPNDLLKSYSTLGWNPRYEILDSRFGLPAGQYVSGLFRGMVSVMSQAAQERFRLGSVCHFSALDSTENRQNIAAYVVQLRSGGVLYKNGLASMPTASGGNSKSASATDYNPIAVANIDDLARSMAFGGRALAGLGFDDLQSLSLAQKSLGAMQIEHLRSRAGGVALKEKVDHWIRESSDFLNIDARQNPVAQQVWSISPNSAPVSQAVMQSMICTNAIDGISGPGVWTLGGCDYHDGTSTLGDSKDFEMGLAIGRAVEYAHRKAKPLFIQLITDGSCDALPGTRRWRGDTNEGMQIFGYYKPDGVPEYIKDNVQIGHFNDAQSAERSTLVGSDPRRAALAVFANYCSIAGRLADFQSLAGVFSETELESLLIFGEG
jgi:hypothetical protein